MGKKKYFCKTLIIIIKNDIIKNKENKLLDKEIRIIKIFDIKIKKICPAL